MKYKLFTNIFKVMRLCKGKPKVNENFSQEIYILARLTNNLYLNNVFSNANITLRLAKKQDK
ncbi:hypothetical protein Avbf_11787 [Armadillidium vulgare]|nr:hypothetical protein Avbf_11787 [Armadillidium vulgare]